MEISYISDHVIRIKGKQVTFITNLLDAKSKGSSDAILLTGANRSKDFFKDENGIIFQGAGEYEIKGTKVTGFAVGTDVMFSVNLDGIAVFVGNASAASLMKDKLHEHQVAIVFADSELSQAASGALNASAIIFSGEKSEENAKIFDKQLATVNKYIVTKEKMPAETEFIFLG